ncbi:MAG: hypothetical protein AB1690_02600 [Candidatus Zixiibacteriota bacterium]
MRLQDKAQFMHEEVADVLSDIRLLERQIRGHQETLRLLYKSLMATAELIKSNLNGELEKSTTPDKEQKTWIVGGDIAVPNGRITSKSGAMREPENIVPPC